MTNNGTDLVKELKRLDDTFHGSDEILGITLLTYMPYVDSSRGIMFTSHKKQAVVLNKTEFPSVFTNYENMLGEYSSYNIRAKGRLEVVNIIRKFDKFDTNKQPALVFVYDHDKGMYDVIVRKEVEDCAEKYGFTYDTSKIDEYEVGTFIEEGDTIYRPTSYDRFGNYGFGVNVPFMFAIKDDIIEDAIEISEELAEYMESTEVELVKISLNENHVPVNTYGDDENPKYFPNIGEKVKDKQLMVKRMINNNHILFDLKASNMNRVLSSDIIHYIDGEVVDINIFSNKPRNEIPEARFNQQVLDYLDMSTRYYERIKEYTQELIDSGVPCSSNIKVWNKNAKMFSDPEYRIKDENNSEFSNIVMYFLVKRYDVAKIGQKFAGRYGNKGVIAKVTPTNEMPFVVEGGKIKIIHAVLATLGVPNRLNLFQVFESDINFYNNQILTKIKATNNIKEKEEMLFKALNIWNPQYCKAEMENYKKFHVATGTEKEYFDIVEEYGIKTHIEPFWHYKSIMHCIYEIKEAFPWIKPLDVYIWDRGSQRRVKSMIPAPIGEMYMMKLKQNSKKGLSARSTGSISRLGVPEKTDSAKMHVDPYSKTPIRFGIQEILNRLISIDPETIAEEQTLYRNSPVGRTTFAKELLKDFNGDKNIEINTKMNNKNAEILSALMRFLGWSLDFEHDTIDLSDGNEPRFHRYNGIDYFKTVSEMKSIIAKDIAREYYVNGDNGVLFLGDQCEVDDFIDRVASKIENEIEEHLKP